MAEVVSGRLCPPVIRPGSRGRHRRPYGDKPLGPTRWTQARAGDQASPSGGPPGVCARAPRGRTATAVEPIAGPAARPGCAGRRGNRDRFLPWPRRGSQAGRVSRLAVPVVRATRERPWTGLRHRTCDHGSASSRGVWSAVHTTALALGEVFTVAKGRKTSAKAAKAASKVLRDARTGKASKTAAGSALSQRAPRRKK
jgi:hypothetical protein